MLTDTQNVTPNEELRSKALAELTGKTESVEETTETQESEEDTTVATAEESDETTQEQSPDQEPPKEDKTKKLYKALGKKDKEIEALKNRIAELSNSYDSDSLELIKSIAKQQALESEMESKETQEREAFLETLPQSIRESIEEDLEQNPQAWRIAQKLYSSQEKPRPKSKVGITGNT